MAEVGDGLRSVTNNLQAVVIEIPERLKGVHPHLASSRIVLVDTPGFDDAKTSEYETLRKIAVWCASW